jgi:ABC-type transport system involved in multi-copper enzyme maturation permease subunit
VDKKLFYVLVVFSVLFSVFCLSIRFKSRTYEEALRRILGHDRWDAAAIQVPNQRTNTVFPSVQTLKEEDGAFHITLTAENPERFRAYILPIGRGSFTPDGASPGTEDFMLLEGARGFERYVVHRLLQGGFPPKKMEKLAEGTWQLKVYPFDKFRTEGAQTMSLFFGLTEFDIPVSGRDALHDLQTTLANAIGGWVGILISIVVTAWFFPNMLQKGSVDLLLARPIPRWQVLVNKYLGSLTFVFLNSCILIGGTWLGLTLATGFVHGGYLLSVVTITLLFAIVYSVSCLVGVLFQSVILSILFPVAFWFFCFLVNVFKGIVESPLLRAQYSVPPVLKTIAEILYYIFPATSDIGKLNHYFMSLGEENVGRVAQTRALIEKIDFTGSILTSLLFTAVVVALAAFIFHRKDY